MSTIKDVANLAKVSVATVSRVLNNENNVKQQTKEKVLQAVKELNYTPNLLARNLRRSNTKCVLVLLPTISNQFYSTIIKGINSIVEKEGYNLMISITELDKKREEAYIEMLKTKRVDGIILFASQISKSKLNNIAKHYPIIQCSEYLEDTETTIITIDNKKAGFDATSYLIGLGHKNIAILTSQKTYTSAIYREKGYREALQKHKIKINESNIIKTDYTYKVAMEITEKLLKREKPPTAIFAVSDSMAIGAIKAIKKQGKIVGKDIDVIGFDDTIISKLYEPDITTISQPRFKMGQLAMKAILEKINDNSVSNKFITLEHNLVVRNSTRLNK
ncbi:LacI family DNA-binding transcriptional regulator [uncultured Tyzzerella sp.]|uniref:LacI family DNA-binding transcriptional regulator n=1 Tax=uncultured Tyzzerella sp. TaxID=2321398 RepID=UPI002942155F|nr:LacI family DNA-binding transcriptional regulator [uncultured Tyzzerella sp.]